MCVGEEGLRNTVFKHICVPETGKNNKIGIDEPSPPLSERQSCTTAVALERLVRRLNAKTVG